MGTFYCLGELTGVIGSFDCVGERTGVSRCKNLGDDSYGFMGRFYCLGERTGLMTAMCSWEDWGVWV